MSVQTWQPSTDYSLGALVEPSTVPSNVRQPFPNSDFELGPVNWFVEGGAIVEDAAQAWVGNFYASINPSSLDDNVGYCESDKLPVDEGRRFTVEAYFNPGASSDVSGRIEAWFYDDTDTFISKAVSTEAVGTDGSTNYRKIALGVLVPAGITGVRFRGVSTHGANVTNSRWDQWSWNYTTTDAGAPIGLIFEATVAGKSNLTEPTWPTTPGDTVVDGEITWTARAADTVTWQANALTKSGLTEPTWPTTPGEVVRDGNMLWRCASTAITDPNCPQTKEVAIASSKIFAGDDDIVRFSATLNPRDWSTPQDAGFLPTGLQQKGQVGVSAMGVYRGNLVVWSESNVQVWQVDPDPIAMALLDSMEGVGSSYHRAAQPVSNDLFFLAALGVRTVGISVGAENLATGDAGLPIDVLIQERLSPRVDPLGMYYPSMGQYWLAFPPSTDGVPGKPPTVGDDSLYQYYFSTQLYPIVAIEDMQVGGNAFSTQVFPKQEEELESSNSFTGLLEVTTSYGQYEFVQEMDSDNSITASLDVVVRYGEYSDEEELESSNSFTGDLVVAVSFLSYGDEAELECDNSFTGTLAPPA